VKHNFPSLPCPPYSPDLAPCDCFFFLQLKETIKCRQFDDVEKIQANTTRQMRAITQSYYQRCFHQWQERRNKCIQAQGHYTSKETRPTGRYVYSIKKKKSVPELNDCMGT
jgi:hypothetical protein